MTRYRFALADPSQDDALQKRMAEDVMRGTIAVSFRRAPSFFAGSALQGSTTQVITCTDTQSGRLVGLGTRATLSTYINGKMCDTGYLCDLRGDSRVRGGTLLARGYRYLQNLHREQPIPLYYTMVLDGNESVLSLLTSGRAGLPHYRALGKFSTPAIILAGKRKYSFDPDIELSQCSVTELDEVVAFVNRIYRNYQFAPVLTVEDFNNGRLAGLSAEDITVARMANRIVGVTACWDQSRVRQIHIEQYSSVLRFLRPSYNLLAGLLSYKPLPAAGNSLACFYLCMMAVENEDKVVFRHLLEHIYSQRRHGHWQLFFAGLHERHPLRSVLSAFRSIPAAGNLFAVHWPEDKRAFEELDQRVPHIEAGAL